MEIYSFFNSVNGDRKYSADDYVRYFSKFITNGVYPNVGSNLAVVADGTAMSVTVPSGAAWMNGYMYENTADLALSIDVADGVLNRIDRIVIRLDYTNRLISAVVKKGTFASSPVAPTLQRDANMYELGIADVYVGAGVVSISSANITDTRLDTSLCGEVNSILQADTTAIYNQFESWYNQTTTADAQRFDDWYNTTTTNDQQQFNDWFNAMKGQLTTDAAGNLQTEIDNHKADDVVHVKYAAATGTANVYAVTLSPVPTAYVEGLAVSVKINVDSTGPSTLNVNSLGAIPIKNISGADVVDLKTGGIYTLRYDGTNFVLQGDHFGYTPVKQEQDLTANQDLNTIVTSGFYRLASGHTNAPTGVDYGQLIVSRGQDTVFQIVTGFNNSEFYMRHGNPPNAGGTGAWQPWRRLWHDGNIVPVDENTVIKDALVFA